jgi:hypothetical protein
MKFLSITSCTFMNKRFQDTKGLIDGHIVQWPTEKGQNKE